MKHRNKTNDKKRLHKFNELLCSISINIKELTTSINNQLRGLDLLIENLFHKREEKSKRKGNEKTNNTIFWSLEISLVIVIVEHKNTLKRRQEWRQKAKKTQICIQVL